MSCRSSTLTIHILAIVRPIAYQAEDIFQFGVARTDPPPDLLIEAPADEAGPCLLALTYPNWSMPMRKNALTTLSALALFIAPLSAQRGTGDDTTVRESSGIGAWGNAPRAVVDLVLGKADDVLTFGRISCIAILPKGRIAVLDSKGLTGPTLYVLDSLGHMVLTLGREGSGPGEFRTRNLSPCLTTSRDGTLLMLDISNSRINRWKSDGTVLSSSLRSFRPVTLPASGRLKFRIRAGATFNAGAGAPRRSKGIRLHSSQPVWKGPRFAQASLGVDSTITVPAAGSRGSVAASSRWPIDVCKNGPPGVLCDRTWYSGDHIFRAFVALHSSQPRGAPRTRCNS
jgi:hypothetical protein